MPRRTRQVTDFLGLTTRRAPLPWWVLAVPAGVLALVSAASLIAFPDDEDRALLIVLLVVGLAGLAAAVALRQARRRVRSQ
jgi:hypothetical protein